LTSHDGECLEGRRVGKRKVAREERGRTFPGLDTAFDTAMVEAPAEKTGPDEEEW